MGNNPVKNLFFALSIVFILISCEDKPMEETAVNPFVGTWENDNGRWVFTATNITVYYSNGDVYWSGTYTYDENNLTYHWDYRSPLVEEYDWPNPQIYPYNFLEDGSLRIGLATVRKV